MLSGFDGLIYSVGFLVGWPIVTFLIAEPLRNLGKYTFADVASFRLGQTPIRILAACGSLVTVAFYLIAQMVGAGKLIQLLFGLDYWIAVVIVGVLMIAYVHLRRHDSPPPGCRSSRRCLLLAGATFMALMVLWKFGFSPEALFAKAVEVHPKHLAIMEPGALSPIRSRRSRFGLALMFGTAGLPHILMRFFTVPNAQGGAQLGVLRHRLDRLFLHPDLHHRLRRHLASSSTNPQFLDAAIGATRADRGDQGRPNMAAVHLADAVGGNVFLGFISAVAFATILAVVAGLALAGASAISRTICTPACSSKGKANERAGDAGLAIATVVLGILAIVLGIVFEKQNVAFMVGLAFAIAASCQLPGAAACRCSWRG